MAEILQFRPRSSPTLVKPMVDGAPVVAEAVRAELQSLASDRGYAKLYLDDAACSEMSPAPAA